MCDFLAVSLFGVRCERVIEGCTVDVLCVCRQMISHGRGAGAVPIVRKHRFLIDYGVFAGGTPICLLISSIDGFSLSERMRAS